MFSACKCPGVHAQSQTWELGWLGHRRSPHAGCTEHLAKLDPACCSLTKRSRQQPRVACLTQECKTQEWEGVRYEHWTPSEWLTGLPYDLLCGAWRQCRCRSPPSSLPTKGQALVSGIIQPHPTPPPPKDLLLWKKGVPGQTGVCARTILPPLPAHTS